jgi:hypothetical protein
MTNSSWQKSLVWILKANLVIWSINASIFAILVFSGAKSAVSSYFSIVTLLETGLALLIGGALAFSGAALPNRMKGQIRKSDEQWSIEKLKSSEKRANRYLILAAIMFAECLTVSFLGA